MKKTLLWSGCKNISSPARILQLCRHFISDLERDETCADISSDAKSFILYFKKGKMFVHNV